MTMNSRLMRPRASGVAYHPEAKAWRTAALANGGTVSASTMQAVSDFCAAIDAAGIRSSFLRLNLVCGGNLAAARTPLYRGASATGTQYGATAHLILGRRLQTIFLFPLHPMGKVQQFSEPLNFLRI